SSPVPCERRPSSPVPSSRRAFSLGCPSSPRPLRLPLLGRASTGMGPEGPRGSELAELVADHRLGDVDGHVLAAVVDGDGVAHHVGDDRGAPAPRLDDALLAGRVQLIDLLEQMVVDERPLLQTAWHAVPTYRRSPRVRRRRSVSLWDSLLLVGGGPWGLPQGDTGCRPPELLPSPPPSGWSTGFMATPRVCGRTPFQRLRPALPIFTRSASALPTSPTVAR